MRIPIGITFPLDLGYDKRLYDYFGSTEDAKSFIQKIAHLASPFFNRPDTGLPIIDWEIGVIKYYSGIKITADQLCCDTIRCRESKSCWNECLNKRKEVQGLREGNSKPLMLFVEDLHPQGSEQTTGCAFEGAACGNTQGQAVGIVDMSRLGISDNQNMLHMARTMAHEFGHLVSTIGS